MPDALSNFSTRATPQPEQADPRQVPNSAGGWTFTVSRKNRLNRFLTLGTEGGTYYIHERQLTKDNAAIVTEMARSSPIELVNEIVVVSEAGRAPRNNPALFALAAVAGLADVEGRQAAFAVLPRVARTGTHLFEFITYMENFRGWGKAARKAVGNWYLDKDIRQAAYQAIKYRQRAGWTHRDSLRLAHPFTAELNQAGGTADHRALFNWLCGRETDLGDLPLVLAYQLAQNMTTEAEWMTLVSNHPDITWEMLPTEALTKKGVWEALIENGMPMTALMRQLPRLTRLGVLEPMSAMTALVTKQLTDGERLRKARVHPINVLIALRTYAGGVSMRGSSTWTPVRDVVDALDATFYAAYGNVTPSGKRTLIALDVSGSMTQPVSGLPLSCREASAAVALVTAATEPQWAIVGFTSGTRDFRDGISPLSISPRQRLDDAVHAVSMLNFGGTDCALPMIWALSRKMEIDHFQVITDSETWAGRIHPHQALRRYREQMGINARMSVIGMTATDFTIADPADPGMLDVAGFDSAVPQLTADFARGDI